MKFYLTYQGRLKGGNSKNIRHIHELRCCFHKQLQKLWDMPPLSQLAQEWLRPHEKLGDYKLIENVNNISFVPLISTANDLLAHLEITFLRLAALGSIVRDGGDIDNRIKTLFDSLRMPKPGEIPADQNGGEINRTMNVLLQDDKLIAGFSVVADRLLVSPFEGGKHDEQDVLLVIKVAVQSSLNSLPHSLVFM